MESGDHSDCPIELLACPQHMDGHFIGEKFTEPQIGESPATGRVFYSEDRCRTDKAGESEDGCL
jgi:hypothetical protein